MPATLLRSIKMNEDEKTIKLVLKDGTIKNLPKVQIKDCWQLQFNKEDICDVNGEPILKEKSHQDELEKEMLEREIDAFFSQKDYLAEIESRWKRINDYISYFLIFFTIICFFFIIETGYVWQSLIVIIFLTYLISKITEMRKKKEEEKAKRLYWYVMENGRE